MVIIDWSRYEDRFTIILLFNDLFMMQLFMHLLDNVCTEFNLGVLNVV